MGMVEGIRISLVKGEILGFMKDKLLQKHFANDVFVHQVMKVGGSKMIRYHPSLNHIRY